MLHETFYPFKTGQPARRQADFCLPLNMAGRRLHRPHHLLPHQRATKGGDLSFLTPDKGFRIYWKVYKAGKLRDRY